MMNQFWAMDSFKRNSDLTMRRLRTPSNNRTRYATNEHFISKNKWYQAIIRHGIEVVNGDTYCYVNNDYFIIPSLRIISSIPNCIPKAINAMIRDLIRAIIIRVVS